MRRVVDTHVHAWPPDLPARAGDRHRPSWDDAARALKLGKLVDNVALVTPANPPGNDRWTMEIAHSSNGVVAAVVRGDHLTRVLKSTGACEVNAVRIVVGTHATADPDRVVSLAAAHRIAVCIQNRTGVWADVATWIMRHPSTVFLVDHLGHPNLAEHMRGSSWESFLALARFANVAVKLPNLIHFTGGLNHSAKLQPYIARALDAFGPYRLLWASDWPNTGQAQYRDLVNAGEGLLIDLHPTERNAVMASNAMRLLWRWPDETVS